MKKSGSLLLALCLMLFAFTFNALAKDECDKHKSVEFKVTGNCSMCKKAIESSLKGIKGIHEATWGQKTKVMKVVFDPAEISEDQIHQKIADSGYDTEKKKASEKAYSSLPECCQYDRTLHSKK
jgi:copper chaperone CopZ